MVVHVFWLCVSVLAICAGVRMIVVGVREDRKEVGDKTFSFHRAELKYTGLPVVFGGLICALILLSLFVGEWILGVAFVLFIAMAAMLCLGGIGSIFTQLGEWGSGRRKP